MSVFTEKPWFITENLGKLLMAFDFQTIQTDLVTNQNNQKTELNPSDEFLNTKKTEITVHTATRHHLVNIFATQINHLTLYNVLEEITK
jgi:hypothetical protein